MSVFETVKKMDERYQDGFNHGYHIGESERIALAKMNSELRSIILELRNKYKTTFY